MKKPFFSITDLVVVAILLVSGTAAWRRLELSNRWAWARESRKAETGEGAVFEYQRIENCPLGQGRTEKKLRRTVKPGNGGHDFQAPRKRPGRTGPWARRPHVYSMFFPSSYADATRDGDRDLVALAARPLELPTGTYFTVRRSREGNMSHGDTEGSHPHRTVTYEWYSPRSPAALLTTPGRPARRAWTTRRRGSKTCPKTFTTNGKCWNPFDHRTAAGTNRPKWNRYPTRREKRNDDADARVLLGGGGRGGGFVADAIRQDAGVNSLL
ncbi:MAG: hypothetical protein IPL30_07870 [Elusimicrobia bacterium]|nr:hypothetical protein [Elusimicrobiota bacterium]